MSLQKILHYMSLENLNLSFPVMKHHHVNHSVLHILIFELLTKETGRLNILKRMGAGIS
jgi:hypothetical protein